MPSPLKRCSRLPTKYWIACLALLVGGIVGVGVFTFRYASGLSYLSNSPEACRNCHVMNDQYDSWLKAPHHAVATCNDCHTPHDFFGKYLAKASNGYHHSKAFTLQDFHEPIQITDGNRRVLEENCRACHDGIAHDLAFDSPSSSCIHCHRGVGHGARSP